MSEKNALQPLIRFGGSLDRRSNRGSYLAQLEIGARPLIIAPITDGILLRLGFAISDMINLLLRLFMVKSLTSVEDGKRARFDLNVKS